MGVENEGRERERERDSGFAHRFKDSEAAR